MYLPFNHECGSKYDAFSSVTIHDPWKRRSAAGRRLEQNHC